jgi:phage-related protein (TIGR01555 family)
MSKRNVKSVGAALSRTNRPIANDSRRRTAVDGLENFVAGLGGSQDKRSYTHYGVVIPKTRVELEAMYRTSWLAKRIVNTVADDMTGNWRSFKFGDADQNPRLEALKQAEKKLKVKHRFNEATRWGRLYGGCLMILGTKDAINPEDMATPLIAENVRKGDLQYIHVLDRWRCAPSGPVETDMTSPAFGMPLSYIIAESAVEIHHSRVIRFGGEKLPYFEWLRNARWDDSVLEHTLNSLMNYDTTSAAIATMMFEANVDVIKSDDITELLSSAKGEEKLRRRFAAAALMKSFNRAFLLDKEEEYEKKSNNFANLDKLWEKYAIDVCGASGIGMTRLFGQSASGLNATGEGDDEVHYKMISGKQEAELAPQLDHFDQVFVRSTLGTMPDDYESQFNPLAETSDEDESTIGFQNAQRDKIYLEAGVITEGLAASELKARGTYRSMSTDDVELAMELSEQAKDARDAGFEAQAKGLNNPNPPAATPNAPAAAPGPAAPPPVKNGKKKNAEPAATGPKEAV